jgi:hypothetical protein
MTNLETFTAEDVRVFGGNQGGKASFARFPIADILEVRRVTEKAA